MIPAKQIILLTAVALLAVGCTTQDSDPLGNLFGTNVGSRRELPGATFDKAFNSGRTVLSHYFDIAYADSTTGVIRGEPKITGAGTRQVAKLELQHTTEGLVAIASVANQRQGSPVQRQMTMTGENYDSVPNNTPAEIDAATTADQNETWETLRPDRALEGQILNDLQRAVSPGMERE